MRAERKRKRKRKPKRNQSPPKSTAQTGRVSPKLNSIHEAYITLDQPGSLRGKQHLIKKFGKRKVKRYLRGQEAYTLHRDVQKRLPQRKKLSKDIADLFQADLVDLTSLTSSNDGF